MGSEAAPPETRPTNVRWVVFALAFGTSWLLYLHRYSLGVIKPELEKEFNWNNEQLGLLDSAFFLFYTIFQFPCGVLADVFGVRLFLAGMILLWSAMLGLQALVFPGAWWLSPLAVLFCLRALFGLGQAGAYAVLSRITRFWFPLSVRTSVQGWIAVFAGRIGGASSNLLFATVLVGTFLLSWRVSLQLFALAGVVLAVLFWLLFRDSPRQHPWVNKAEADLIEGGGRRATRKLSVRDLFRGMNRRSVLNLLALNLQSFLSTVADFIYVGWIPQFLSQTYNMSAYDRGIYATLPLLGGACGGPLGG
ncbi:MAG TPA: MFS transporter, partial [Gemmataceae bacterium]|nr:MFS transporter [Gemmataceae bacterium]